jgi:hypothetical protein
MMEIWDFWAVYGYFDSRGAPYTGFYVYHKGSFTGRYRFYGLFLSLKSLLLYAKPLQGYAVLNHEMRATFAAYSDKCITNLITGIHCDISVL